MSLSRDSKKHNQELKKKVHQKASYRIPHRLVTNLVYDNNLEFSHHTEPHAGGRPERVYDLIF